MYWLTEPYWGICCANVYPIFPTLILASGGNNAAYSYEGLPVSRTGNYTDEALYVGPTLMEPWVCSWLDVGSPKVRNK